MFVALFIFLLAFCLFGLIVTLEGIQGSGKSTAGVGLAVEENKRTSKLIYSNDHLNHPDYRHFDTAVFVEKIVGEELEDMILLTDEMYQMADSRSSMTKLNKLWTYFAVQTRKRGVDMYICTHNIENIDLRLRKATDIRGSCRYYPEIPCRKCKCKRCGGTGRVQGVDCSECQGRGGTGMVEGKPCDRCFGFGHAGWVKVFFLDRRLRIRYDMDFYGPGYWGYFDTHERIPMSARLLQGIDTNEVL
jgi:hypothetical protein